VSTQPWTIDAIAHALPHPELRAQFQREATFTEVSQLPAIGDRWVDFIQRFEADQPRVERLRRHVAEHGTLPADYEAGLVEISPDELRPAARGAA
jgi:hypothetical protein